MLVTCVLKSGGHYGPEYVERLADNLKSVTPDAELICLSDMAVPVPRIRLKHNWPGWWSKLELFRPGLFSEQVLFVDLDTVFRRDIAPLFDHRHEFIAIRNFMHQHQGMASAVMSFSGDQSHIYERFLSDGPSRVMAEYRHSGKWGDQDYIKQFVRPVFWQDIAPGEVTSVKCHARTDKERIVCFHGKPKPADVGWDVFKVKNRGWQ